MKTVIDCHHAAPRSTTKQGTQSIKGANIRAIVPYELSDEVRIACEKAMSVILA